MESKIALMQIASIVHGKCQISDYIIVAISVNQFETPTLSAPHQRTAPLPVVDQGKLSCETQVVTLTIDSYASCPATDHFSPDPSGYWPLPVRHARPVHYCPRFTMRRPLMSLWLFEYRIYSIPFLWRLWALALMLDQPQGDGS